MTYNKKTIEDFAKIVKDSNADYIVISISAQQLRNFCQRINQYDVKGKTFDAETGRKCRKTLPADQRASVE